MLKLDAETFYNVAGRIHRIEAVIESGVNDVTKIVSEEVKPTIAEDLVEMRRQAILVGAEITAMTIDDFGENLKEKNFKWDDVGRGMASVKNNLRRELRRTCLYVVDPKNAEFLDPKEPIFGQAVFDKFGDARDDIEEAGKCLALSRAKATVCHLMLAMEIALRELAAKLGATVQNKDDKWLPWLIIANNMDAKIKLLPADQQEPWWEVHSMLSSVGRAWRNPTMHPAKSYDVAQAKKVFDAVNGFMNDLAQLV